MTDPQADSPTPLVAVEQEAQAASLEAIEALSVSQRSLVESMDMMMQIVEKLTYRLSQMEKHQEFLIQSQEKLLNNQETIGQSMTGMSQSSQQLLESITHLDRMRAQLTDNLGSTNAAVERLDRLVDYLIRRDGERKDLSS